MNQKRTLYAMLVCLTAVWGGAFVAIKQGLRYLDPLQLVLMRFLPTLFIFAAILWIWERDNVRQLVRNEWRSLCLMGLLGVTVYHLTLNTGQQTVSVATASLLIAFGPSIVFVLSVLFLHERVTWTRVLGLCIAFAGVFIVIRWGSGGEIDFRYLRGVLITALAPLSWSIFTVVQRPLVTRYSPLAVTATSSIVGTLPILAVMSRPLLGKLAVMPWDGWLAILFLSLVCTVGGYAVWGYALSRMEAPRVSIFHYLVPLWAGTLSRLLLHEPLPWALFVGGAAIIGGVILINRRGRGVHE